MLVNADSCASLILQFSPCFLQIMNSCDIPLCLCIIMSFGVNGEESINFIGFLSGLEKYQMRNYDINSDIYC